MLQQKLDFLASVHRLPRVGRIASVKPKTTGVLVYSPQNVQDASQDVGRGQVSAQEEQLVYIPHGPSAGKVRSDRGRDSGTALHFRSDRLQGEEFELSCGTHVFANARNSLAVLVHERRAKHREEGIYLLLRAVIRAPRLGLPQCY